MYGKNSKILKDNPRLGNQLKWERIRERKIKRKNGERECRGVSSVSAMTTFFVLDDYVDAEYLICEIQMCLVVKTTDIFTA